MVNYILLNYSPVRMKSLLKIVVTGPVGAGKTTFIQAISEISVINTDRKPTDDTAQMKSGTTVAMDFGRITLGDDMWVQIYGTPGQKRFQFMWDVLIKGAHGYVLLVPAHLPSGIREAKDIKTFMTQREDIPFVVGVTHADHPDAWDIEDIQFALGDFSESYSYITVNANHRSEVAQVLLELIQKLEQDNYAKVA